MNRLMLVIMALLTVSSISFAARCVEDNECDSGDVCILGNCYTPMECKATDECGGTDVCYRGICISPTCIVTSECPTDFLCDEGKCIPMECLSDTYCGAGQECINYECVTLQAPEPEPEEEEDEKMDLAAPACPAQAPCPDCACNFMCQPCESKTCPKLECPTCGPFDGELGIPILLFGLVVVAALGFFAGKMGANPNEEMKLERIATANPDEEGKDDINDEGSYRYI